MAGPRTRGLDASSVQGPLPYDRLKTGPSYDCKFVICKAQEGNKGFDPAFETNVKGAFANGLEPFAYCFGYPLPASADADEGRDPKEQAQLFVDKVCRYPEMAKRPLFLDYEWPAPTDWQKWKTHGTQVNAWCRENAAEVARLMGVKPIIYTYPWWWSELSKAGDTSWALEYGLWIASYNTFGRWPLETQSPIKLQPWGDDWLVWQFDGDGGLKLPNGHDADFCLFNGDLAALQALAGYSPARAA